MEVKHFEIKNQAVNLDQRTFEGYAATWQRDLVDDVIHHGAFAKSIKEAFPAGKIKVLWQHSDPLGMPIEMREDGQGLFVRARVSKTRLGDEALELMRDGVIDRMSIGFSIPNGKSDIDENSVRHIREVKLFEFSPVTFPANETAVITGVKSISRALMKGAEITGSAELTEAIRELQALISKLEPVSATPAPVEPPDLSGIESLISDLGEFARTINTQESNNGHYGT